MRVSEGSRSAAVPATDGPLELALSVGEPGNSEDHVVTLARDAKVSALVAGLGESAPSSPRWCVPATPARSTLRWS